MSGHLDRETTNCCKGIAAIVIMLHHISFRLTNLPIYLKPIWYIAFPIVGFFFFMSGYGLTCGLMQKQNYLHGFLTKRLSNIIGPYLIVALFWIVLEICVGGQTPARAFAEAFSIRYIQPLWFIWIIITAYIVFYLVFKRVSITAGVYWFAGITIVYILLSAFFNPREEMYASVIGMPIGMLWAVYQEKVNAFYRRFFWQKEFAVSAVFMILFAGRLLLSAKGIENQLIQAILRNLITAFFVVTIAALIQKIKIRNRIAMWLGTISYEIYIVHPFILYLFEKKMVEGKTVPDPLIITSTIVLTLIFANGLKSMQGYLIKKVKLI